MAWAHGKEPRKTGRYLVTACSKISKKRYVCIADRYEYPKGNFTWNSVTGGRFDDKIIAWQKLPKPFEEE